MSELPMVIVANIGDLGVEQSYPNIVIEQANGNINPPSFFNQIYEKHPVKQNSPNQQLYLFLPKEFRCVDKFTIQKMVDVLSYNDNFTGVYSDMYLCGKTKNITYVPAYDKKIIDTNIIVNTPIMFSGSCRPIFHDKIKHLHFYQVLTTVGQRFIFCHVAEPLFSATYKISLPHKEIKEDMEIISSLKS